MYILKQKIYVQLCIHRELFLYSALYLLTLSPQRVYAILYFILYISPQYCMLNILPVFLLAGSGSCHGVVDDDVNSRALSGCLFTWTERSAKPISGSLLSTLDDDSFISLLRLRAYKSTKRLVIFTIMHTVQYVSLYHRTALKKPIEKP